MSRNHTRGRHSLPRSLEDPPQRPVNPAQYSDPVKRPLTLQLVGGLGNQLFSYYACAAQAARLNVDLIIDDTWVAHGSSIRLFDLSDASVTTYFQARTKINPMRYRATRWLVHRAPALSRLLGYYEAAAPGHDLGVMEVRPGATVRGYFQSWQQVSEASGSAAPAALRLQQSSEWLMGMCEKARTERPIGVHVRRGDYRSAGVFGLVGQPYYRKAIEALRDLGQDGPIWLFTDEPASARDVVPSADLVINAPSGASEELILMSHTAGFVTANSSFSWWGAWLSGSRAVVAPHPWFYRSPEPQGLIPPWWIRLPASWADTA